jgi:predicted alpha/beta superfamily hydrolase
VTFSNEIKYKENIFSALCVASSSLRWVNARNFSSLSSAHGCLGFSAFFRSCVDKRMRDDDGAVYIAHNL